MQQQSPAAVICHCYQGCRSKNTPRVLCGTNNLSKKLAFPLNFGPELIIPLIQHLGIIVSQLAVLNSKLVGLLSPQGGSDLRKEKDVFILL